MRIDKAGLFSILAQAERIEEFEEAISRHYFRGPSASDVVDFLDVPAGASFDVPPEKAIEFFKAKRLRPTFSYADMLGKSHAQAFTVAKMMDIDMLGQIRASLESAQANGTTFREWADSIVPMLQAGGWWGRKEVVDPVTGQTIVAQLGSPSRLETIFRTNMQSAYAAGQWDEITRNRDIAPLLMYDAVDDFRTRPLHASWDKTVLPVNSPWWNTHYPPNGYNCRCGVIQIDPDEAVDLGLEVAIEPPNDGTYKWTNPRTGKTFEVPNGIDPGFDFNVGKAYQQKLTQILDEKVGALPDTAKAAAQKALVDMRKQIALVQKVQDEVDVASEAARIATLEAQARANATADAALARAKALAAKKAKEADALKALVEIAKGKGGLGIYGKNALGQLSKIKGFETGSPLEKLAAVEAKAKQLADAASKVKALAGYEKAVIAGKVPTKNQLATFNSLSDEDKAPIIAKIDAEKAKIEAAKQAAAKAAADAAAKQAADAQAKATQQASTVAVDGEPPDPTRLSQTGPQKGSNEGGIYLDSSTGRSWYVKFPSSEDIARNEVLAAKLYKLAGLDVPELHLIEIRGRKAIASGILSDVRQAAAADLARAPGAFDGFGVDAWLANWDTVGLSLDNLLLRAGKAVRIDVGGSLRYRAQGGLKGSAFGSSVDEIDSLRDPRVNRQSADVFGKMTQAQIEESVARVLRLNDDDIRAIVEQFGPIDAQVRRDLYELLLRRKADLARRFPNAVPRSEPPVPLPDSAERVSAIEQKAIEAARANGYSIRTDGPDIEDHNLILSTYREGTEGVTRAWFKLRPDAQARVLAEIQKTAGNAPQANTVKLSEARDRTVEWIKGVNKRATDGGNYEQKDLDRAKEALRSVRSSQRQISELLSLGEPDAASAKALEQRLELLSEWGDRISDFVAAARVGQKAAKQPQFAASLLPDSLTWTPKAAPAQAAPAAIQWVRERDFTFKLMDIERGSARATGNVARAYGVRESYRARLPDGTEIRFVPNTSENTNGFAMQGVMQIDVRGVSAVSSAKVFELLDKLGIDSKRATDEDRAHYFLNAFARLRFAGSNRSAWANWQRTFGDKGSITDKLAFLKRETGVDIERTQAWQRRAGEYQAFGHGRVTISRPDLETPEFAAFEKDALVYHNPQGLSKNSAGSNVWERVERLVDYGGALASLSDRVRRGVQLSGSSVESDLETGGGDYVFTRIKRAAPVAQLGTGLYWKPRVLRRLDAITYSSDSFGRTKGSYVEDNRTGQTVASLRALFNASSDETIFKGALSLFDDLQYIVLSSDAEVKRAIQFMQSRGYQQWPDGRRLEEVIVKGTR